MDILEKTVLIIEDERNSIGIPPRFFETAGYKVEISGKAAEGVEMSRRLKPGIIVVDMLMPDMPGDETLRELSEHPATREIPVIVALPPGFFPSGISELKKMGKQVAVVKKPVTHDNLHSAISAFGLDEVGS